MSAAEKLSLADDIEAAGHKALRAARRLRAEARRQALHEQICKAKFLGYSVYQASGGLAAGFDEGADEAVAAGGGR